MASTTVSSSSSSSNSFTALTPQKYDVFISFRGEDTRQNFTSHLHSSLCQKQIQTFIDYELHKGSEISLSLIQAIKDSSISVVVFSENYASSKWCLNELNQIMQCREDQGQVVIPVFYNVDPSHVRKQEGSYKQPFQRYKKEFVDDMEKVQKWKDSLTVAANLSGLDSHSRSYRDDAELVQKIVKEVLEKLNSIYQPDGSKSLVGIYKNCAAVESLMREDQLVGIWGMGGIGKTTIATTIFKKYSYQYEGSCFLDDVRERSGKNGRHELRDLRNQLHSELLGEQICQGGVAKSTFVKERLRRQKNLVVIDDVRSSEQLKYLVGELQPCNLDSRIIITTRDKSVLESTGVKKIHKVEELDFEESLQLFSLNAFNEEYPRMGRNELSRRAVTYCKGIPLALVVLGSFLRPKSENEWDSALKKLEKIPNEEIQNVLRMSYDDLNDTEQEILLDITCFFKGMRKEYVINLLDSCGFYAVIGVRTLHDKALINISDGYVWMHDLIQEMGWEIVRQESIKNPGKRSRLWDFSDIYDVLKYNEGTAATEGIIFDVSQINKQLELSADTFKNMPNLRFLKIYSSLYNFGESCNLDFPSGLESFSDKLRYLEWNGYPLKSLPQNFCAELLIEIQMPHSHVEELWQGVQDLGNLEEINLSGCKQLTKLPDLSRASKLERVFLSNCTSLCDLHPSLLSLETLVTLWLDGCIKLKSLKSEKRLRSLRHISVKGCNSLKEFSVSSVSINALDSTHSEIEVLHSSSGYLRNLKQLSLDGSRLENLPNDLSFLTSLETLSICGGLLPINKPNLHNLFDGLRSLRTLWLKDCDSLSELPDNICMLASLQQLWLDGSGVERLPANIKNLQELVYLSLSNCRKLQCLPELPPSIKNLYVDGCTSLVTVSFSKTFTTPKKGGYPCQYLSFKNCMKLDGHSLNCITEAAQLAMMNAAYHNVFINSNDGLSSIESVRACCPGSIIPSHFPHRTTEAKSCINVELSSHPYMLGFFFSVVLDHHLNCTIRNGQIICECYYVADGTMVSSGTYGYSFTTDFNSDHVYMWYESSQCCTIPITYEGPISFVFRVITYDHDFNFVRKHDGSNVIIQDVSNLIKECGVQPMCVTHLHSFLGGLQLEFNKKVELGVKLHMGPNQLNSRMQKRERNTKVQRACDSTPSN